MLSVGIASAFLLRTAAALGNSALVLILVGFGAQRFLTDVIAGALHRIGDFVKIEPAQASGLVEQLGFRSAVLRSLNGDRTYIPTPRSSQRRAARAATARYSIELLTSDVSLRLVGGRRRWQSSISTGLHQTRKERI